MTQPLLCLLAGAILGAILGALAAWAWMRPRLGAQLAHAATLRTELAEASAARVQLDELRGQSAGLRHDMRGILSPALLVSDRLLTHDDAHVRRAGDVMVRTVERATARLNETREPERADAQG